MTILIIDDEAHIRSTTRLFSSEILPDAVIYEADGVQSGLQAIDAYKPDIVLLDVEMQDGTGFDLIRKVAHPSFQLVFITAHNQYAVNAFEFSAIDFVVKPVDEDLLKRALERAVRNITTRSESTLVRQVSLLQEHLQQLNRAEKKSPSATTITSTLWMLPRLFAALPMVPIRHFILQAAQQSLFLRP